MMNGNINLISYDCYQQATEKQLAGLKWKENRVYYVSEIHNEKLQDEIYGYIDDRCRRLSLSTAVNDIYRFDLLKEFLNEKCTSCSSITDKKWEELERSYKAFLYKKGLALYVRRNRPDRRNVEQQSSAQVSFLKMYYEYVAKCNTADIPENEKDVWDMRKLDIVPRSNPIRGRYRLDFREIRQKEFKEIIKTADIPENEKDVWDMRKLDIVPRSNPIRGRYRLDFREIRQKEFKEIIKKILYSHCQTKAMGSIKGELRGFRRFASFMYDRFPEVKHFTEISRDMIEDYYSHCQTKAMGSIKGELRGFRRFASFMYDRFPEVKHFTEISRDMIEDYLVYIKTDTGLTSVSYTTELSVLDNLLDEIGRELEIENLCNLFLSSDCRAYDNALPEAYSDAEIRRFNCALTKLKPQLGRCLIIHLCNLFLSSDCRAYDNALPEAYSDAEIRRFNCALTKLKPQLGRCLIIHQMLGTRIEDTLTLRRDCLSEKSGHYFITIIQQKTRKYKRPVSNQLAELIRKAIEVSEKEHPDSEYIFLQDNGKLYTDSMLKYHVNIMIYENDIRDDNGNYFEFRTHRFRHTFGVKLTEMKLYTDSMLKYHVNIMIYENDIRDDNGNYFEFRTHRFRHTFGVKLTEMKLDDDSIARLLGHKDTRTIPHYRRLRNEALAEDTKAVRDEMNELLAQYRREKENAETR